MCIHIYIYIYTYMHTYIYIFTRFFWLCCNLYQHYLIAILVAKCMSPEAPLLMHLRYCSLALKTVYAYHAYTDFFMQDCNTSGASAMEHHMYVQGIWKSRALSAPRWCRNFEMNEWMKKTFWASNFALKPKLFFRRPVYVYYIFPLFSWRCCSLCLHKFIAIPGMK